MAKVDLTQFLGFVNEEDRKRWSEMQKAAQERIEQGGGIGRVVREAVEPGMNLAQQALGSQMQAAHHKVHNDARAERPMSKFVYTEEHPRFIDDEHELG
ncbi:hypothetical protein [Nocardiopsis synnemataformans]|uniref:hypothetical protein n=1 Tax=Nocardiopsis synnemataformans TaxID=61305 RepID=UPI003EBEDEBE